MSKHLVWPTFFFFFFNDTATTEIYTLSLHDALPISVCSSPIARCSRCMPGSRACGPRCACADHMLSTRAYSEDRKSTRLNSSHLGISYAVFCLKKKQNQLHMS